MRRVFRDWGINSSEKEESVFKSCRTFSNTIGANHTNNLFYTSTTTINNSNNENTIDTIYFNNNTDQTDQEVDIILVLSEIGS